MAYMPLTKVKGRLAGASAEDCRVTLPVGCQNVKARAISVRLSKQKSLA